MKIFNWVRRKLSPRNSQVMADPDTDDCRKVTSRNPPRSSYERAFSEMPTSSQSDLLEGCFLAIGTLGNLHPINEVETQQNEGQLYLGIQKGSENAETSQKNLDIKPETSLGDSTLGNLLKLERFIELAEKKNTPHKVQESAAGPGKHRDPRKTRRKTFKFRRRFVSPQKVFPDKLSESRGELRKHQVPSKKKGFLFSRCCCFCNPKSTTASTNNNSETSSFEFPTDPKSLSLDYAFESPQFPWASTRPSPYKTTEHWITSDSDYILLEL